MRRSCMVFTLCIFTFAFLPAQDIISPSNEWQADFLNQAYIYFIPDVRNVTNAYTTIDIVYYPDWDFPVGVGGEWDLAFFDTWSEIIFLGKGVFRYGIFGLYGTISVGAGFEVYLGNDTAVLFTLVPEASIGLKFTENIGWKISIGSLATFPEASYMVTKLKISNGLFVTF